MHRAHEIKVFRCTAHRHVGDDRVLGDAGIALKHARDITRRHAGDQGCTADRPRFEEIGEAIGSPRARERLVDAWPAIDPGILIVDAKWQAVAPVDQAADGREEVRRDSHQHEIDLAPCSQRRQNLVAAAKCPHADVADKANRPRRHSGRMDHPQARRYQRLEIGIGSFLVEIGIAGHDDRLPAEFGQITRPQPRPLGAHQVAGDEVAADNCDTAVHRAASAVCARA